MGWFKRLSVGSKLIASFVAVSMVTAAVGAIGVTRMASINDRMEVMYKQEMAGTVAAMEIGTIFLGAPSAEAELGPWRLVASGVSALDTSDPCVAAAVLTLLAVTVAA